MEAELDQQAVQIDRVNYKCDANFKGGKKMRKRLSSSPSPPPSLQVAVADVRKLEEE